MGAIIRKYLPILNKSARMKEMFDPNNTRILTGFRRHKNLKELLSQHLFPTHIESNNYHPMQVAKSVKRSVLCVKIFC